MTDYDDRSNQRVAANLSEEVWAMSLGFKTAHAYHQATDEAFDAARASIEQWEQQP